MIKICVFVANRANYSSIRTVLDEIKKNKEFKLQLVVGSGALSDKFGSVSEIIKKNKFKINYEISCLVEGSSTENMLKTSALCMYEFGSIFHKLKPDIFLAVGDRFEIMAAVMSAITMNIRVAHTMGGEVSGALDESFRHAITKLSHIHFPASIDAKKRIIKLGEKNNNIFLTGCPRIDYVKKILHQSPSKFLKSLYDTPGVGDRIDINKDFLIVMYHPVTTEIKKLKSDINSVIQAIKLIKLPAFIFWPNPDAGSDTISREYRKWREHGAKNLYFFKNLPNEIFFHLLNKTRCLVGNSSAGIRECSFIGTPVVNIGSRQNNRERGKNVIDVKNDPKKIVLAIKKQISSGKYKKQFIYGNGSASKKILSMIKKNIYKINIQKKIQY